MYKREWQSKVDLSPSTESSILQCELCGSVKNVLCSILSLHSILKRDREVPVPSPRSQLGTVLSNKYSITDTASSTQLDTDTYFISMQHQIQTLHSDCLLFQRQKSWCYKTCVICDPRPVTSIIDEWNKSLVITLHEGSVLTDWFNFRCQYSSYLFLCTPIHLLGKYLYFIRHYVYVIAVVQISGEKVHIQMDFDIVLLTFCFFGSINSKAKVNYHTANASI